MRLSAPSADAEMEAIRDAACWAGISLMVYGEALTDAGAPQ
ncbi:hypothetical protein [Variovorax sp. PCZ-1]|nr:hypothetical protein [Variovorax sp. PCZ-1]